MSSYNPPVDNLSVFSTTLFREANSEVLTQNQADKRYLKIGETPSLTGNNLFTGINTYNNTIKQNNQTLFQPTLIPINITISSDFDTTNSTLLANSSINTVFTISLPVGSQDNDDRSVAYISGSIPFGRQFPLLASGSWNITGTTATILIFKNGVQISTNSNINTPNRLVQSIVSPTNKSYTTTAAASLYQFITNVNFNFYPEKSLPTDIYEIKLRVITPSAQQFLPTGQSGQPLIVNPVSNYIINPSNTGLSFTGSSATATSVYSVQSSISAGSITDNYDTNNFGGSLIVEEQLSNTLTATGLITANGGVTTTDLTTTGTTTATGLITANGGLQVRKIVYNNSPMFAVGFTGTAIQTIPNITDTIVNYPVFDLRNGTLTGITYSAGVFTNSNTFSITLMVNACVTFASNTTGTRAIFIDTSGQGRVGFTSSLPITGSGQTTTLTTGSTFILNPVETFSIKAFQASGGNLNITGSNTSIVSRVSILVM